MIALPRRIETLADARTLEAAAHRVETPCGDGAMVWRVWGDGPPVVLVHGGSGSWAHWVRNIAALVAGGRRVYACDLPGCGESAAPPTGHDGDVLPPWIEAGVAAMLGDAPFDLVGFSFGGMVAALYARDYGQRVRRLVLVGAPALSGEPMPDVGLRDWRHQADETTRTAAIRYNLRRLMFAHDGSVDDLSQTLYAECLVRDRLTKRRLASTDIVRRAMPRIVAPVWGIWGAQDMLYRHRFDSVHDGIAGAPAFQDMTLIPSAGHWVQFEEADAFDRALRRSLDGPVK